MAKCPFATWKEFSGASGSYKGGPFKIIHHSTEGSKATDAFTAYKNKKADPHFTVDTAHIYQHVDTATGARALKNPPGGVDTNRLSALQIEVVGFAGSRKPPEALKKVARLCRWLEKEHSVPRVWPNGPPNPAKNGKDPGKHNRSVANWTSKAGHYGHCHVPENDHWDPAYDAIEVGFLMAVDFDAAGNITNSQAPAVKAFLERPLPFDEADPDVIVDHADVGEPD